ncbi:MULTISPECIES: hypothetical protein [Methylococcus]|uniref:hypothetical protein n=1 Tax=Methylococcus TaxID=413 RepID=UPI00249A8561|nr:hypothetical protein [Methylococcus capsulatus]
MTLKLKSGCFHRLDITGRCEETVAEGYRYSKLVWGEHPLLYIEGVGDFHLRPQESSICCMLVPGIDRDMARYWVINFVLPVFLLLNGRFEIFHGSAVDIGNGGVAFLAESMGGKSTLANFFVRQGHALLSDEHLGIVQQQGFCVVPSVPYIRAFRMAEVLGDPVERFAPQPLPLRAIFLLDLGEEPARVVPLTDGGVLAALAGKCHLSRKLNFLNFTKERFSRLAELAEAVPVAKLCVPRDLSRLPEVYETVLSHLGEPHDSI